MIDVVWDLLISSAMFFREWVKLININFTKKNLDEFWLDVKTEFSEVFEMALNGSSTIL